MKLALVTETFAPEVNGVAMTLGQLAQGWVARGYRVELVTPARGDRDRQGQAFEGLDLLEVPGMPLPRYTELRFGLPCVFRLQRQWQKERPQWVHIATEGPLGWSAFQVARELEIPVVSSYHTHFDQYGSHYGYGVIQMAVLGWMRSLHNQASLTFVPSESLLKELGRRGFNRLCLMGRGVDTRRFHPRRRDHALRSRWDVGDDQPVALYVGRLAAEKNLPLVFAAYDELRRQDPGFKLVVVGDGPERAKWQQRYPEVCFEGRRTGVNLARYYASADCFLFASETETFGNVVTEAMASGLLVFAYGYAAAGEFIEHGVSGVLAPKGNAAAYLGNVRTWGLRRGDWPEMRARARARSESISWDVVVDSYLQSVQRHLEYRIPTAS